MMAIKVGSKMGQTTCEGCGAGWTFMGTGYCGPCLEKLDQVPAPLTQEALLKLLVPNKGGR